MAPSLRELSRRLAAVTDGVRLPTGGARKTHRAYACPPCRIAIPGPAPRRPANGAAAEIAARLHLPLAAAGRNSSRFPTAAEKPYGSCMKWETERLAAFAIPGPASRRPANGAAAEIAGVPTEAVRSGEQNALRGGEKPFGLTLILRFFDRCGNCGWGHGSFCERGTEHLAVPEKRCGLTLFLAFFDRCGNCDPPASAAGGGGSQFLIILNSGGSDCILKAEYGIVCPSKDGIGNTA